jgi:deazaflavin-dependent oxidoreductase (nitroreductase family)
MDDAVRHALATDRTVDITTVGRRSGTPRRIETWFYRAGERFYLSGTPGRRSWFANLAATPEFTFHLKRSLRADLPARARVVKDLDERRAVLAAILSSLDRLPELDTWVARSPLVEVAFE